MSIVGLKPVADLLGISTSRLRYFLDKDGLVPYRRCDIGGNKHLRIFTDKDLEKIEEWWTQRHQK